MLGCKVKIKKVKFLLFLICAYCIANSAMFALGIAFFEKCSPAYCWEHFKFFFLQINMYKSLYYYQLNIIDIAMLILIFIYEIAILYYPVSRFWKKRTVYNAWLVAITGIFLPNYIYVYFFKDPKYTWYPLLVMNAGYGLAWLMACWRERHNARCMKAIYG